MKSTKLLVRAIVLVAALAAVWVLANLLASDNAPPESVTNWISALTAIGTLLAAAWIAWWQQQTLDILQELSHKRDYALKGYERHVEDTLDRAFEGIDGLINELRALIANAGSASFPARLNDFIDQLQMRTNTIRSHGLEADMYLETQGTVSNFEVMLQTVTRRRAGREEEIVLEDVIAEAVSAFQQSATSSHRIEEMTSACNEASLKLAKLKSEVRAAVIAEGREIASGDGT